MKSSLLKCTLLILCLFLTCSAFAFSFQSSFSAHQTKEIEKIVHQYLVDNPEVLVEMSNALKEKQMKKVTANATQIAKENADELFRSPNSPVVGNANGKITVVEFFDYQCGHCREVVPMIDKIIKNNPSVRVVYKLFPIFGPQSVLAAKVALAAHQQGKFTEMHHTIMSSRHALTDKRLMKIAKDLNLDVNKLKQDIKSKTIDSALKKNHELAKQLRLMGTPEFIIAKTDINAKSTSPIIVIPGAPSLEKFQQAIDQVEK